VTELLAEVDAWQGTSEDLGFVEEGATMRKLQDFEKTKLKPYVETFEKFVKALLKSETRLKREREDDSGLDGMEF
jgi:DNA primase small subunit